MSGLGVCGFGFRFPVTVRSTLSSKGPRKRSSGTDAGQFKTRIEAVARTLYWEPFL